MAGGDPLVRALDGFAAAFYCLRRSNFARRAFILLVAIGLGLTLFARPGQIENQIVRDVAIWDISTASVNTYVRVSGVLDPAGAYTTGYNLGGLQLYGSRYVPLVAPGTPHAIWVADENLPTRDSIAYVTLVAQVMMGQGMQQPPLYLRVGYPPDVVLANFLARLGSILLILMLIAALVAWAIARLDYAIPLLWSARPAAHLPELLWFGELGRQFDDLVVRSAPTRLSATPHEARFESADPAGPWSVVVRRLKQAQLFDAATRYGRMPAARLHFEDERGLQRRGVIATDSAESRDAILRVLSLIR
ncbi:MAG: hypothetical protein RML99_04230 [Anaerolineae bacterium]|nr:hypothetical protein [Anaerolineae bacterium]